MQSSRTVTVSNENGLHARPAMQVVECASAFECEINLYRVDGTEGPADAKSVMQVITLAATKGTEIRVDATGDDAEAATEAMETLFESKFGEDA